MAFIGLKKFLGDVVKKTTNAEIIIVDNASTDNSVNYVYNNHQCKTYYKQNK